MVAVEILKKSMDVLSHLHEPQKSVFYFSNITVIKHNWISL